MKTIAQVKKEIIKKSTSSAWELSVKAYAIVLLNRLEYARILDDRDTYLYPLSLESELLNGAKDWKDYSKLYNSFVKGREKSPNTFPTWLDFKAKALQQAYEMIKECAKEAN